MRVVSATNGWARHCAMVMVGHWLIFIWYIPTKIRVIWLGRGLEGVWCVSVAAMLSLLVARRVVVLRVCWCLHSQYLCIYLHTISTFKCDTTDVLSMTDSNFKFSNDVILALFSFQISNIFSQIVRLVLEFLVCPLSVRSTLLHEL